MQQRVHLQASQCQGVTRLDAKAAKARYAEARCDPRAECYDPYTRAQGKSARTPERLEPLMGQEPLDGLPNRVYGKDVIAVPGKLEARAKAIRAKHAR